jgi:hypothetical protein
MASEKADSQPKAEHAQGECMPPSDAATRRWLLRLTTAICGNLVELSHGPVALRLCDEALMQKAVNRAGCVEKRRRENIFCGYRQPH